MQVTIIENTADQDSWKTHDVPDVLEFLTTVWPVFPENARIYHQLICNSNDITPGDQAGVDQLKILPGPFYVVVYPNAPIIIIAVILFAVAAVALAPNAGIPALPIAVVAPSRNIPQTSSNNELSDRVNRARINGRIPDIFGKVRSTPDLIAAPYKVFEAGREVEYAYMCIGRGFYDVSDVRDGATLCSNIPGVSIGVYAPFKSPNSGDAPQLSIGDAIDSRVLNVRRSNSVNGQVLRPPNQAVIRGLANIIFRYPNIIQYAVVPGAETEAFSSQFAEGDSLVITSASQASTTAFLTSSNVTMVGAGAPLGSSILGPSFNNGGWISFLYPEGTPAVAPVGMVAGRTLILTQNIDATPGVADYRINTTVGDIVGAGANMSGTFTILEVAIYVTDWGVVQIGVLLDDPGSVNANWDAVDYGFTIMGLGAYFDRFTIGLDSGTALPAFNLAGTYTIVTVTADTIILNNPAGVNSDWNILHTIAGDASPPLGPVLTVTGRRWVGPFVLDSAGATSFFANFVSSNGLYRDDGTDQFALTIDILVEVTPVNSSDVPIGPPETTSILMTGSDVLRETVAYTMKAAFNAFIGRCQVRATRVSEHDSTFVGQVVDEVRWRDVYAVTPVIEEDFGNVTTVQSKTFATSSALAIKERKLSMLVTRKLPPRIGTTSSFNDAAPVATRNAADILVALCRDTYIGNRSISEIDVTNIYDTVAYVQDYFGAVPCGEFCYTFDNDNLSFEETASVVAQALHCVAYRRGNVIKLSFEELTEDGVMLFNHRNKLPKSEIREFTFGYSNENDGIEFTYVDPADDSIITIFLPVSHAAINPKKLQSIGVRDHLQAYFLAWRAWNKIRYQKYSVRFDATQEADLLLRNDRILVSDSTKQGTQDGEVVAISGFELTLSQDVAFGAGSYTIFLQHPDETIEPMAVTAGSTPRKVIMGSAISQPLIIDPEGYTRTGFILVKNTDEAQLSFLVTEKEPVDKMTSTVTAINYDDRYYANDNDFYDSVIGAGGYGGGGGFTGGGTDPPYTPPPVPLTHTAVLYKGISAEFDLTWTGTNLTSDAVNVTLPGGTPPANTVMVVLAVSNIDLPRFLTLTYAGVTPDNGAANNLTAGSSQRGHLIRGFFAVPSFGTNTELRLLRNVGTEGSVSMRCAIVMLSNCLNASLAAGLRDPNPLAPYSNINIVTNPTFDVKLQTAPDPTAVMMGELILLRSNDPGAAFETSSYTTLNKKLSKGTYSMTYQLGKELSSANAAITVTFSSPQSGEQGAVQFGAFHEHDPNA